MKPRGRAADLFEAFSRINAKAYVNDRLVSCPNLSKAPNYGDVLRRYIAGEPIRKFSLARTVCSYCLHNFGQFFFLLLVRFQIGRLGWKLPAALRAAGRPSPVLLIDTFALLPGIAKNGNYSEGYLPGLFEAAQEEGLRPIRMFRMYGSRNSKVLRESLRILAQTGPGLTEVHLLRWPDWFALLGHLLTYPLALFRLIRSLPQEDKRSPEAYIREALLATAGQNCLDGEVRRLAGRRLGMLLAEDSGKPGAVRGTPRPSARATLVSWYENQTVNKGLHRGLKQAEMRTGIHLPAIGAQLFTWPDVLLNNHPDDREIALGLTPDRVVVNGPYFLPETSEQDYRVGPSLRYGHVFQPLPTPDDKPEAESGPLLVLLSYHPEETRRVLSLVLPLARNGKPVQYKFHPATIPDDFKALLPEQPELVGGSLFEALNGCGAVIGSGSGSLAEAAALGRPVLAVKDQDGQESLSLNYLPAYGQGRLWEFVSRPEEVSPVLERLESFRKDPDSRAMAHRLRDMLFTRPDLENIRILLKP